MTKERRTWRRSKNLALRLIVHSLLVFSLLGSIPISCGAQNNDSPKSSIATVTVGCTYLYADHGGGERSNLNGWFARPSVTIGKSYAAFADFTNYYGANHKGSINSHGFTFGRKRRDVFYANGKAHCLRRGRGCAFLERRIDCQPIRVCSRHQFCNTHPTVGITINGLYAGGMGVPLSQGRSPQRFQFQDWS